MWKPRVSPTSPRELHFLLLLPLLVSAGPLEGQDVELLGEIHGTRPPDGYFQQLRNDPESFRFEREGRERLDRLRQGMRTRAVEVSLPLGSQALAIGPREEPVLGPFRLPLVLGLFSDRAESALFTSQEVQAEFFDGPNSYLQTLSEFYAEVSSGLVQLEGATFDWQQTGMARADVTLGQSGLGSSQSQGVGAFVEAIVQLLDEAGVDWSQFDQSGDGYVDVLAVFHPEQGAECDGATDRIWSHRWTLRAATEGRLPDGFRTSTPRPYGQDNIYIDDYIIQPLLSCDGEEISEIGTFAHELGHGFGLPDLYPTSSVQFFSGVGNWDLMGTGGWGCQGGTPERPCHLGAWSKLALGWITAEDVAPDTDEIVTLEAVQAGRRVLRLQARDGSNEYILLENRQRQGSDQALPEPGLLIWHIDEDVLSQRWTSNTVNTDAGRMGVWLRQADGREDLTSAGGGRGDPGDAFPGCIKPSPFDYNDPSVPCGTNHEFHAGKPPEALSHRGGGLGATLTDIELLGAAPHDVRFRLNTQISTITLEAEQGGMPADLPGFEVDGVAQSGTPIGFLSAPFQSHEVSAPGGILLGPDTRISFEEWADGAPRNRMITTQFSDETFVAIYRDEEIRLVVTTNDPAQGILPATFTAEPGAVAPEGDDLWFPRGTAVSVLATPRTGFVFRDWVGVAAPLDNPVSFTLDEPAQLLANFDLVYSLTPIPETLEIEAAMPQEIVLEVNQGNDPVTWSVESGLLPLGLALTAEAGVISGAATQLGEFEVGILARDGIGLEARVALLIRVVRPKLSVELLLSQFLGSENGLTAPQKEFLDLEGNSDGGYDIGDLRAYLLASPDFPQMQVGLQPARTVIQLGDLGNPRATTGAGR